MADTRVLTIVDAAQDEIGRAGTRQDLEEVRIRYLGKKGTLTQLLRSVPSRLARS